MRLQQPAPSGFSLWRRMDIAGNLSGRWLRGADAGIRLDALSSSSGLSIQPHRLRGKSVLVVTQDQLAAALAMIELDGVVRRLLVCPPGLSPEHCSSLISAAGIDLIVCDTASAHIGDAGLERVTVHNRMIAQLEADRETDEPTEWILLTSGTTGRPKMTVHTLPGLTGAIGSRTAPQIPAVWSTFYDIRRYGGLQIFLRAMLGGGSMILSSAGEGAGAFLARTGSHGVTHISGTPSHWRASLMSAPVRQFAPRYIRLSGEIADQGILDRLRAAFREADIAHAFASTEAGVAFDVKDGLAGFPAGLVGRSRDGVEMKVENGSLRIKSPRTASRYLDEGGELRDADGFIDTGDMVELHHGRYHFVGRRDGLINTGGLKVHPEEIEAVINLHPRVRMCCVRGRRNPIVGAIVSADVVAEFDRPDHATDATEALRTEIIEICKKHLARHKIPAVIRFVPALGIGASGKLAR